MVRFIENERIEFKGEYNNKVVKTIMAFANTSGGRLYIGIDDDGNVIGVEDHDETERSVSNGISDSIAPDLTELVSIETIECEGKDVVKIEVNEGDHKPYYWREKGIREGGVYIRKGPSSIPASEARILKMVRDYSHCPFEEMVSLKQDLTFDYTRSFFEARGLELEDNHMQTLGMKDRGMYTNLALLLSDQFKQDVKMALYHDEFKSEFLDSGCSDGSVLKQLDEAYDFVISHNNRRAVIDGKFRVESKDYPDTALREVICNALIHREYGINGSTLISMYDDKMTVVSIGGLNRGLEVEDVLNGVSSRRNERLASVFMRLGLIENYGSGIPRIMGLYENQARKPWIDATANSFRITLPKMSMQKMSPEAKTVLEGLSGKGEFTRSDVENMFGVSRSKAYEIVTELLTNGSVERIGSGRGSSYRVLRAVAGGFSEKQGGLHRPPGSIQIPLGRSPFMHDVLRRRGGPAADTGGMREGTCGS